MKGVPGHGVGARPDSHGAGEKGDSEAWFGGVRVSTALHGCTRQYSWATRSFGKASDLGENLEGFLPSVSPTRPRPSPTQRLSDGRPQDTTDYPHMAVSLST